MAYEKQTWENLPSQTTPINADRLTHIEDGIFNAAATADTAASNASSAISGLADKVDKVEGKGLSTNDFTDTLKTKLDNIEAGAEVNVQSDWNQSDNSADDYIKNKPTLGTSAYKNSTSVVTQSTDLVESGAVKKLVGWGNKNIGVWYNVALSGDATVGYKLNANGSSLIAPIKNNTNYTVSKKSTSYGNRFRIILFKNEPSFTTTLEVLVIVNNSATLTEYTFNSGAYNYVVFTYESSDVITQDTAEAMIELGDTKTAYEPYHESVEQTLRDAEVVQGKNLFNPSIVNWNDYTYADGIAKNAVTDTREFLLLQIQGRKNGSYVKELITSLPITTVGNYEVEFTIESGDDINQLYIRHSGSSINIAFIYPFELKGTYKLSFKATGVNPTVVKGIVLSDIMISANGGAYEPYYIPLKDVVPNKADNSVIAPVENGSTASQAYAVGEHFIRDGAFCTCKQAISQGGSFTLNTNYTAGDVAGCLIKQESFTKTTNISGNFSVSNDMTRNIVGVRLDDSYIGLPYYVSNYIGIHVVNASTMSPITETSVTGTYFYV